VLHDDALVQAHFPQALLLARECIAWGATAEVLTPANLARARAMAEAWEEQAHPPASPLRVAAVPLAGGNSGGPVEPVPRCSTPSREVAWP
jgi:hypothetical protein